MLTTEMINYSGVKVFSKHFPKCHSNITVKSAPFESGVDLKA